MPPIIPFITSLFLGGIALFAGLHYLLRVSPDLVRFSLVCQGVLVLLLAAAFNKADDVATVTKSSPEALKLLVGLIALSALLGVILSWM